MYDGRQKNIMIEYRIVNSQEIYNLKIKKIYIQGFVQFDKYFCYYNSSHMVINDNNNEDIKLGNIWNKADNDEFSEVMIEK